MAVEFLTDEQAARYGSFHEAPSRAELERYFFWTTRTGRRCRRSGGRTTGSDVARLSPFVRHHINVLGRYSFQLPDLPGGLRPLRDKRAADDE